MAPGSAASRPKSSGRISISLPPARGPLASETSNWPASKVQRGRHFNGFKPAPDATSQVSRSSGEFAGRSRGARGRGPGGGVIMSVASHYCRRRRWPTRLAKPGKADGGRWLRALLVVAIFLVVGSGGRAAAASKEMEMKQFVQLSSLLSFGSSAGSRQQSARSAAPHPGESIERPGRARAAIGNSSPAHHF